MTDEISLNLPILVMRLYILFVYDGSHNYSHIVLLKNLSKNKCKKN